MVRYDIRKDMGWFRMWHGGTAYGRNTCIMAAFKSEFIHSYGIFHPTAPNFRLSRMRALKNTSEKHNFLNALAAEHDSYSSSCR